jgi:lysozyme
MNLSAQGLALIKSFEGFRSSAYKDANGLWACGYGHTSGVTIDTTCDEPTAEQWLAADSDWAQDAVNRHVTVPMSQNQFDALVSFTYNVGAMAFIGSTLLSTVNAGNFPAAAGEFLSWDHIDGVEIAGLERRRQAESDLFQGIA